MIDVPDRLELTAVQARVLGCLIEKQATTPDAYPITLNGLTAACNQSTSRDPVMRCDPREVEAAVLDLKALGLARVVHPTSGERATKYRHVIDEALDLDNAQRAVIAVLLLRGPQSAGELRTRCERIHAFGSVDEVDATLDTLARAQRPLTRCIGRQPGQRDDRWIQLLGPAGSSSDDAPPSSPAPAHVAPPLEPTTTPAPTGGTEARIDELEARLARVEARLDELTVRRFDGNLDG